MKENRIDRPKPGPLGWRLWAAALLALAIVWALYEGPLALATPGQLVTLAAVIAFLLSMAMVRL